MTKKFPLTNWSEKKLLRSSLVQLKSTTLLFLLIRIVRGASVSSKKTRTNSTIWRSLFT